MSCNNSCNSCSCNNTENSYEDSEDIPEYKEFIPNKEYAVGEFFKINNEVFKVIDTLKLPHNSCVYCDFNAMEVEYCNGFKCDGYPVISDFNIAAILYDTLED